jgi:hypothetical protein
MFSALIPAQTPGSGQGLGLFLARNSGNFPDRKTVPEIRESGGA